MILSVSKILCYLSFPFPAIIYVSEIKNNAKINYLNFVLIMSSCTESIDIKSPIIKNRIFLHFFPVLLTQEVSVLTIKLSESKEKVIRK